MGKSEAFWHLFKNTGHIGAYLLYRDYMEEENIVEQGDGNENLNDMATGGEI